MLSNFHVFLVVKLHRTCGVQGLGVGFGFSQTCGLEGGRNGGKNEDLQIHVPFIY